MYSWSEMDETMNDDICGLCGEPGADKMAAHTGGGVLWPGEMKPSTDYVHQRCERKERGRAHAALSDSERVAFLGSIR